MLKAFMHDITLAAQSRSGISRSLVVWEAILVGSLLTAFILLCVAVDAWLTVEVGSIAAGLILAGSFLLIAIIAAVVCAFERRRTRQRAILERAARAHATSWLLDPKLLATAVEIGRVLGWRRIVPVALLGFMAAQWTRDQREGETEQR
jgi:hypothetical protein